MGAGMTTRVRQGARRVGAAMAVTVALGVAAPTLAGATGVGVYNLRVTEASGVVSASWAGGFVPTYRVEHATARPVSGVHRAARGQEGDYYFTCTLLLGYTNQSSFTQTTTGHSCSFYGLDTSKAWGVAVQEFYYNVELGYLPVGPTQEAVAAVAPMGATGNAPRTPYSIVCKRGTQIFAVTGVSPHCPAHSHRVG